MFHSVYASMLSNSYAFLLSFFPIYKFKNYKICNNLYFLYLHSFNKSYSIYFLRLFYIDSLNSVIDYSCFSIRVLSTIFKI